MKDLHLDSELGNGRLYTICEVIEEAKELMAEKKFRKAETAMNVAQEMAQRMERKLTEYKKASVSLNHEHSPRQLSPSPSR